MKHLTKPMLGTQLNWAHPLNKGLAGFWLFNEGNGDKVNDLSMNGNMGTLTNMAFPSTPASGWNPGRKGIGLNFDGSNDYVDVGNGASLNITTGTIDLWFKSNENLNNTLSGSRDFVTKGVAVPIQYRLIYHNTEQKLILYTGSFARPVTASATVLANTWNHLVVTFIAGTANNFIYLNGINITSTQSSQTLSTSGVNVKIGGDSTFFSGLIDEVRIYNRALSAPEIQELYINPYGMFL